MSGDRRQLTPKGHKRRPCVGTRPRVFMLPSVGCLGLPLVSDTSSEGHLLALQAHRAWRTWVWERRITGLDSESLSKYLFEER